MNKLYHFVLFSALVLFSFSCNSVDKEAEKQAINELLTEFLDGAADNAEIHDRFWAEDLIYTSSAGSRFGKSQIMAGFDNNDSNLTTVLTRYHAEDTTIRIYGDTAALAFTLVAELTQEDGIQENRFYNSGTLRKMNGQWRVVQWQATVKADE